MAAWSKHEIAEGVKRATLWLQRENPSSDRFFSREMIERDMARLSPQPETGGMSDFAEWNFAKVTFYDMLRDSVLLVMGRWLQTHQGIGLQLCEADESVTTIEGDAYLAIEREARKAQRRLKNANDKKLSAEAKQAKTAALRSLGMLRGAAMHARREQTRNEETASVTDSVGKTDAPEARLGRLAPD